MAETVQNDYEVSSEGAVRHWEIPYARLSDTTPTPTNPAKVTGLIAGKELTGTILTVDAARSVAVIDFTNSMVYRENVRNVLTYSGGNAEASWTALNIGVAVFYDDSSTMPAGVYLSTSPLKIDGAANSLFGHIVPADETDTFPKGDTTASTQRCAVMQVGAAAGA
jgi:hypothetical protein